MAWRSVCPRAVILLMAFCLPVAALTSPASGQTSSTSSQERDLGRLLVELSERSGIDLLFDQALVRGLRARRPPSLLPVEAALDRLLSGTGLGYRRTPDGIYLLFALSSAQRSSSDTLAVPEILVTGRRLQNVDIRRTPNDVQPYKVLTADRIAAAHRDNIDQLLRARLPGNADFRLGTLIDQGGVQSSIDLRGVGTQRTLVLVDGRRIPMIPNGTRFSQPDVSALALNATERIETLTGTAGGIYGPGAIGGVVNIVLRRDYRGFDLFTTTGFSDRLDAKRLKVEARLGFSTADDHTQFMLFGSYDTSEPLRSAQRDYAIQARQIAYSNLPRDYIGLSISQRPIISNAILVYSNGPLQDLVLKPEYGGTNLRSDHSYMPIDLSGDVSSHIEHLIANAGTVPFQWPRTSAGQRETLVPTPRRGSVLFSARQRIGDDGLELFADGFLLADRGSSAVGASVRGVIDVDAPGNPFRTRIFVAMPSPTAPSTLERVSSTGQLSVGAIIPIAQNWQASADISRGWAYAAGSNLLYQELGSQLQTALRTGQPVSEGQMPLRPLDDWQAFSEALPGYIQYASISNAETNHTLGAAARLAGRLGSLPGGPVSLSLLAEARRERTSPHTTLQIRYPGVEEQRYSIGGELHAPVIPRDRMGLFRGLELQLAVRIDAQSARLRDASNSEWFSRATTTFTVGAKMEPWPFLAIRGSYATGSVMPTADALIPATRRGSTVGVVPDLQRGGEAVTSRERSIEFAYGGNPRIDPERASTLSLGLMLDIGARISVDYSRISIHDEINDSLTDRRAVAFEGLYPGRVVREALTEEDKAKGYKGGRITLIDYSAGNFGATVVHSIELNLDWKLDAPWGGTIAPYAAVAWQPSFRARLAPDLPWVQRIGFADGPLEWRANGGFVVNRGPSRLDVNAQYLSGYRIINAINPEPQQQQAALFQGGDRLTPQFYVDIAFRHQFALARGVAVRSIEARLGILNIFNRSPPIIAESRQRSFSPYGDPRGRRFELVLAARY